MTGGRCQREGPRTPKHHHHPENKSLVKEQKWAQSKGLLFDFLMFYVLKPFSQDFLFFNDNWPMKSANKLANCSVTSSQPALPEARGHSGVLAVLGEELTALALCGHQGALFPSECSSLSLCEQRCLVKTWLRKQKDGVPAESRGTRLQCVGVCVCVCAVFP